MKGIVKHFFWVFNIIDAKLLIKNKPWHVLIKAFTYPEKFCSIKNNSIKPIHSLHR